MNNKMNILNAFFKELGYSNVSCQYIELAIRKFTTDYNEKISRNLIELANSENLNIQVISEDYKLRISKSYIVSSYSCFDKFLDKLGHMVICSNNQEQYKKKDKESELERLWRIIPVQKSNKIKTAYKICEYYRLVRNCVVHNEKEESKRKLLFSSLKGIDIGKLKAPNEVESINFDDNVLFSKSAHELAKFLYDNIPYDKNIVLSIYAKELYKQNIKYSNMEKRKKRIEKYLSSYYSNFTIDDFESAWKIILKNNS